MINASTRRFCLRLRLCLPLALATAFTTSFGHAQAETLKPKAAIAPAEGRKATEGLSQKAAADRASVVSEVRYQLHFDLSASAPSFSGTEDVTFTLAATKAPLLLDFAGGAIEELKVNGRKIKGEYDQHFLAMPASAFKVGANTVSVTFTHPYSTTGLGLTRFHDPEDKRTYLHSQFEAYSANKVFPSFDQPDLKAVFTMSANAPESWVIVSAARESKVSGVGHGMNHWVFNPSDKISTYLFSLHAGDYQMWEDHSGKVPLRIFARRSLAKYVDTADLFHRTQQALTFYGDYFAFPYPFHKLDQVFAPEFGAGGMENVASIAYTEGALWRGVPTKAEQQGRTSLLFHEIAHQWFGDLVTMQWWNGLWLNESFATYMEKKAQIGATEYQDAWTSFAAGKAGAYREDQLVTTHPVDSEVDNTAQAFANFDSITYGKGASVLKQLDFYLGADAFRDGVRAYFKKYQFSNATLADFTAALSATSGIDLKPWAEEWLKTAGVNTVEAKFKCEDNQINSFELAQTAAPATPTLRTHRTAVGLYTADQAGALTLAKTVNVTYQGALTPVPELKGAACPAMVFPNHGDQDYVKVNLDPVSLVAAKQQISQMPDPIVRMMLWSALWEMVRDGSWRVTDYADTVLNQAPKETDLKVLAAVLGSVYGWRGGRDSVISYLPTEAQAPGVRAGFLAKASALFAAELNRAAPGSDLQKVWFDAYTRLGEYPEAEVKLADLLSGKLVVPGLVLDQDRRWVLVQKLSALGLPEAAALRAAELKRDPTSAGQLAAIEAEAADPSAVAKDKWYQEIIRPNSKRSLAQLRAAMRGLYPNNQTASRAAMAPRYFTDLTKAAATRDHEFVNSFAGILLPAVGTPESERWLTDYLEQGHDLPPIVQKMLKIAKQEDGRCVRLRSLAAASGS